jgi:glutaredoxin 3
MAEVKLYTKTVCPYCIKAKNILSNKGVEFEEINVEDDLELFDKLKAETGMRTVPQIFINGELIGGASELSELEDSGRLEELLNQ